MIQQGATVYFSVICNDLLESGCVEIKSGVVIRLENGGKHVRVLHQDLGEFGKSNYLLLTTEVFKTPQEAAEDGIANLLESLKNTQDFTQKAILELLAIAKEMQPKEVAV